MNYEKKLPVLVTDQAAVTMDAHLDIVYEAGTML